MLRHSLLRLSALPGRVAPQLRHAPRAADILSPPLAGAGPRAGAWSAGGAFPGARAFYASALAQPAPVPSSEEPAAPAGGVVLDKPSVESLVAAASREIHPYDKMSFIGSQPPLSGPLCSSDTVWSQAPRVNGLRDLVSTYMELTKFRLSIFVTLSVSLGALTCPALAIDATTLAATSLGTFLCVSSANSFNQLLEYTYDSQMKRTSNRPLAIRKISPGHTASYGVAAGLLGGAMLSAINPLTAALGVGNILLYSGLYTYMKRTSPFNTHVGAVVGAIPPLMGYTALSNAPLELSAYSMSAYSFLLLYLWQFPHFHALSHGIVTDYTRAGYQMLTTFDMRKASRSIMYSSAVRIPCPPSVLVFLIAGVCHPSPGYAPDH
ncbi:hypothetical protein H696_01921 [Fonticula alba]|uniref:Protoheme IX farnesyltransferase, mitochondrial n=1 Tax=Fonticula alba TaxID=691883 RepID=A0A058Z9L7_FONAL|nr:hypothetical protein H696_01921 [Fonticula alba]KCV70974.1 hypothetical protein H696_01921 [Fonticula alba]|eukprot:XP_009494097.1 hypothetical protein H696_01921 [Fonticula alba]